MTENNSARLTSGPIKKHLIRMTIPMIYGIIGMIAFNLVDTYFIGQYGDKELAAIGFTMPVVFIINGIIFGLGTGASAVISKAIGNNDIDRVRRVTTDALSLGLILVIIVSIAGSFTIEPVFSLMDVDAELMPLVKEYMQVWYWGAAFVVIPMLGNNAIRATGDTKTPSNIMLIAVAANFIMDPLFIFGFGPIPEMGLQGAALATVFSRGITFFVALYILYYREKMITFRIPSAGEGLASWKSILYIGLPNGLTNIIAPLGMGIITKIVASYGHDAVAGITVTQRVEAFALAVLMALGSALGPIIGQNWGAKKFDRVQRSVSYSIKFGLAYGLFVAIILWFSAGTIASLFNDDPDIIGIISLGLSIVPMSYTLISILMISNVTINILNQPVIASVMMLSRIFGVLVPLIYLGSYLYGIEGIFIAVAATNISVGIISYFILMKVIKRERLKIEGPVVNAGAA